MAIDSPTTESQHDDADVTTQPGVLVVRFAPQVAGELEELAEREGIRLGALIRRALGREKVLDDVRREGGRALIEDARGHRMLLL